MSRRTCLLVAFACAPLLCSAVRSVGNFQNLVNSGTGLCDAASVREECSLLGGDAEQMTFDDLKETLAATEADVKTFWRTLFPDGAVDAAITCQILCDSTVAYLGQRTVLPPSPDVGCYKDGDKVVCDLDLAQRSMEERLKLGGKAIPDLHDAEVRVAQQIKKFDATRADLEKGNKIVKGHETTINYSVWEMSVRVANLFRIYPLPSMTFANSDGTTAALLETAAATNASTQGWQGCVDRCRGLARSTSVETVCLAYPNDCGGCDICRGKRFPARNWQVEVQQRSQQAQAYITTAIKKFKRRATQTHINRWFGSQAFSDQSTRQEVLRVLNSVDRMLGNVHYVFPGQECAMSTYAYVFSKGAPDDTSEDTMTGDGQYIFYLCALYVYSDEGVQVETLTHEGSHHATSFTDDVCMDEVYDKTKKKPELIEYSKNSVPAGTDIGDYLQLNDGTIVVVRLVQGDKITLQLDPPMGDDCEHKAYGRQACEDLASQASWKALRNADNFCYYVQDISDER